MTDPQTDIATGFSFSRWEQKLEAAALPVSLAVVSLLFALYFVFFTPYFDVADDGLMCLTAAGTAVTTAPDPHLLFSNVLVGHLLAELYGRFPSFPWYGTYLLAVQFCAHVTILCLALRSGRGWWRIAAFLVFFLSMGVLLLNDLQFTSTALLAGIAGAAAVLQPLSFRRTEERRRPAVRAYVAGVILLVVAALVRYEAIQLIAGIFLPLVLIASMMVRRVAVIARSVAAVLVAGSLVVAAGVYDVQSYKRDPGWRDWPEWRTLFVQLFDYARVVYGDRTKPVYDEVGWTRNDYRLLRSNFIADDNTYSIQAMSRILTRGAELERRQPYQWLAAITVVAFQLATVPVLVICPLLAFWVCTLAVSRRHCLVVLGCLILVIAASGYLLAVLQRLPPRVFFPLASFPAVVAVCYVPLKRFDGGSEGGRFRFLVRLVTQLLLVILLACVLGGHRQDNQRKAAVTSGFLAELERLGPQPEQLFVTWQHTTPCAAVRPLGLDRGLSRLRVFDFGPAGRTAGARKMLRAFGIDDIHRAILTREDVFLSCSSENLQLYRAFLREHYDTTVSARLYYRSPIFPIYVIRPVGSSQRDSQAGGNGN